MIPLKNQVYHIEPSLSLLYCVVFGNTEMRDVLHNVELIWQDPLRRPGMKIIFDGSLATSLNLERADIQTQIDHNVWMMAQGNALEPTALIGREGFDLTMSRVLDLQVTRSVPIQMNAFLTLREAVAWLGLGDAYEQILAIQRALYLQTPGLRFSFPAARI